MFPVDIATLCARILPAHIPNPIENKREINNPPRGVKIIPKIDALTKPIPIPTTNVIANCSTGLSICRRLMFLELLADESNAITA